MNIKTIPADELVTGTKFIPAGRKRPVEIVGIWLGMSGRYEIMATSTQGMSAHIVSRSDTVQAIIPDRLS